MVRYASGPGVVSARPAILAVAWNTSSIEKHHITVMMSSAALNGESFLPR